MTINSPVAEMSKLKRMMSKLRGKKNDQRRSDKCIQQILRRSTEKAVDKEKAVMGALSNLEMVRCQRGRKMNINDFLNDRNQALTKAVMDDDWKPFRKYCKKYGIQIPKDKRIMKAGCYKAVQGCNDISDEVKDVAFKKCLELGFSPLFNPEGDARCLN